MPTRYAIIDGINVINVVEYENPPGNPPPGFSDNIIAVESAVVSPGWTYVDDKFIEPPLMSVAPVPTPIPLTPQEKLAAAGISVNELKELLGL